MYLKWFLLLIKNYKIIFELITNILDFKLVSKRLIETNLE